MAEKDYFSSPVKIKKTLVFSQKDLYKHLKKGFKDYGYSVDESNYDEGLTAEGDKSISFSWSAGKKISGYVKLVINMYFEAVFKDVTVKKDGVEAKAQKGTVALVFTSLIKKDPESEWELNKKSPFNAFFRELYDKLVKKGKMDDISGVVKSDLSKIMSDAKLFLKLKRYD